MGGLYYSGEGILYIYIYIYIYVREYVSDRCFQGAFIYEFGDHGGLIVMADDLKKTGEASRL